MVRISVGTSPVDIVYYPSNFQSDIVYCIEIYIILSPGTAYNHEFSQSVLAVLQFVLFSISIERLTPFWTVIIILLMYDIYRSA